MYHSRREDFINENIFEIYKYTKKLVRNIAAWYTRANQIITKTIVVVKVILKTLKKRRDFARCKMQQFENIKPRKMLPPSFYFFSSPPPPIPPSFLLFSSFFYPETNCDFEIVLKPNRGVYKILIPKLPRIPLVKAIGDPASIKVKIMQAKKRARGQLFPNSF